jgi:uncharacterized protein YjbI with pentapeptide repeats
MHLEKLSSDLLTYLFSYLNLSEHVIFMSSSTLLKSCAGFAPGQLQAWCKALRFPVCFKESCLKDYIKAWRGKNVKLHLDFSWNLYVRSLAGLIGCSVRSLNLAGCSWIGSETIRVMCTFPLEVLDLSFVSPIWHCHLGQLKDLSLHTLILAGSNFGDNEVRMLRGLLLRKLDLSYCKLITTAGLQHLVDMPLENLNLTNCRRIESLSPIGKVQLKTCTLENCSGLKLLGLAPQANLTYLNLTKCKNLRRVDFTDFPKLQTLILHTCISLDSIRLVTLPLSLQVLILTNTRLQKKHIGLLKNLRLRCLELPTRNNYKCV